MTALSGCPGALGRRSVNILASCSVVARALEPRRGPERLGLGVDMNPVYRRALARRPMSRARRAAAVDRVAIAAAVSGSGQGVCRP